MRFPIWFSVTYITVLKFPTVNAHRTSQLRTSRAQKYGSKIYNPPWITPLGINQCLLNVSNTIQTNLEWHTAPLSVQINLPSGYLNFMSTKKESALSRGLRWPARNLNSIRETSRMEPLSLGKSRKRHCVDRVQRLTSFSSPVKSHVASPLISSSSRANGKGRTKKSRRSRSRTKDMFRSWRKDASFDHW